MSCFFVFLTKHHETPFLQLKDGDFSLGVFAFLKKLTSVTCYVTQVSIGNPEKMEPITNVSQIPSNRWALICCLCKEKTGACIQVESPLMLHSQRHLLRRAKCDPARWNSTEGNNCFVILLAYVAELGHHVG